MMRRIFARFRTVAPPMSAVAVVIFVFGLFSIPQVVFGQKPAQGGDPPARRFLILAAMALGVYRAVAFHPYFGPNYLRWLKMTPWTVRKPLPMGPVELVPQDAIGIGLMILLGAIYPAPRSIELVNIFLLSHMICIVATFWRTQAAAFGYFTTMLLGFVPLLWTRPWLALLLLTGIYLVVHEGLWRSLKGFPWNTEGVLTDMRLVQPTDLNPPCGWFFDRFHRDIINASAISRIDAALVCMLGSWWLFVLSSLITDRNDQMGFLFFCTSMVMLVTPIGRIAIYTQGCRFPISLWGRVVTFRWIIPGFDHVFLGPICALLAGPAALIVWRNSRIPGEIALSLGAGLTVLIALVSPPRLRRWRLTGQHRLGPTFQESQAAAVHKMGQP
jgi:hypothetical protein